MITAIDFEKALEFVEEYDIGAMSFYDNHINDWVVLGMITSYQKGGGNMMMKAMCQIADMTQTTIILGVSPEFHKRGDKDTLNKKQLIRFYHNWGFKFIDKVNGTMLRKPTKLKL